VLPENSPGSTSPIELDSAADPALKQTVRDDDEQGSDQEFPFGSMHVANAHALVDRAGHIYEEQFGIPFDDKLNIPDEVREDLVEMFPGL